MCRSSRSKVEGIPACPPCGIEILFLPLPRRDADSRQLKTVTRPSSAATLRARDMDASAASISFAEAFRFWLKLGFISFGGPAGQIAIMHRVVVDEKKWIEESRFLHALNFCVLLPGPEAQKLATYLGWLLHGTRGGLAAGIRSEEHTSELQ